MQLTPVLMFQNDDAEEAMHAYMALFPDSRVISIERYGAGESGKEGTVKLASFELNGARIRCIDSPVKHAFTFTPAMSLFIDCDDAAQIDDLAARLGEGGQPLMPPGEYGFSTRFAWVQDRFGVSWQLNFP
jgi:predicted 3-demethylubiquinone-9 3-methyltransferase (glyoxalase superfamily)